MRPRKTANKDLPPRMLRRVRTLKSGKRWIGYYYDGKDPETGKRVEIPLGNDLDIAKIEWAKLDRKPIPKIVRLLNQVFDRYERDVIPQRKPSTQREYLLSLKQLRGAFGQAPIDAVTPHMIAQYRDARTAKVRANREMSLLSHIYNMAREWGVTEMINPVTGVRKNKETPRDFYATDEIWSSVYSQAPPELRDAMDLAYLRGQRPSDVLRMREADVVDGYLFITQSKRSRKLRIRLAGGDALNGLGVLIERLREQRRVRGVRNPYLIVTVDGRNLTKAMLRLRYDEARRLAVNKAVEEMDHTLAESIRNFQFRHIRPKAASEIDDLGDASKLLGHSDKRITQTVYRRVGEIVKPTR